MTPDLLTAALAGIAGIIVAIAQLAKILKRTKTIQENTNGALETASAIREDLEREVAALKKDLFTAIEEKLKAAAEARQAASDVQNAIGERTEGR